MGLPFLFMEIIVTPELGKLITDDQERDAVHIAIYPSIAGMKLYPSQSVYILDEKAVHGTVNPIGIVDPFLKEPVYIDQKFWIFLYPNTITSLRHDWTHPSFKREDSLIEVPIEGREKSEEWMRNLADQYARYGYDDRRDDPYKWLMDGADRIVEGVESYIVFNVDCHGDIDPQEFWRHYQIIRGKFVTLDVREDIFSCSC